MLSAPQYIVSVFRMKNGTPYMGHAVQNEYKEKKTYRNAGFFKPVSVYGVDCRWPENNNKVLRNKNRIETYYFFFQTFSIWHP